MKSGNPSKVMQFLVLHANKTMLCARDTLWHCTGSRQAWHPDVLDQARADLLAFSVVPIHCSLASLAGSRLSWEAARHEPGSPCTRLPGLPARLGWNHCCSRFSLCTTTIRLSTGKSPCPWPCHAEGLVVQEILSWELFSLFLNDRLFVLQTQWFLYKHIFQRFLSLSEVKYET